MPLSLDLINEFEETFQVEQWNINGLRIWPAIRIHLIPAWEKNLQNKNGEFSNVNRSHLKSIVNELKILFYNIFFKLGSISFRYQDVDIGVWGYHHRVVIDSVGYSVYGDSLQDIENESEFKILCLEHTLYKNIKPYRANNVDITSYYYLAGLKSRILSILFPYQVQGVNFEEVCQWCHDRGLDSSVLNARKINKIYFHLYNLKKYYLNLLKRFNMKLCLKICWYNIEGMALSWAAKDAGIRCFDLQHGVAGACSHRAYTRWSRLPKNGYKIMPNGFWTWSDKDAEVIRSWGDKLEPPIKLFVGGNLWQRLWKEGKFPEDLLVKTSINQNLLKKTGINILFTLQTKNIPSFLFELLEKSPTEWNWWIRCHPTNLDFLPSIEKTLKNYNADVINATKAPLPLLLKNADVHITGWSAVVYDSLEHGLRSIVYHPFALQQFNSEIETKEIFYISKVDEIIKAIASKKISFKFSVNSIEYPSLNELFFM